MLRNLIMDRHTDDADVTFNICLGREFEASGLTFCGGIGTTTHRQFSCQYGHVKGWAVAHLGTKRHGADDITVGERNNLIVVRCALQQYFMSTCAIATIASRMFCVPTCCGMNSGATIGHSVTRRVTNITNASTRRRVVHPTLAACQPLTIATICNTRAPKPLRHTRIAWARQQREVGGAHHAELHTMID